MNLSSFQTLTLSNVRAIAADWLLPSREMKRTWYAPVGGFAYIAIIAVLGGLRGDHVMLGCLGLLDLYNHRTRSFLRTFLPLIATGAIFDSMRYYYWPAIEGRVHIAGPYNFDKTFFSVGGHTLNEYFAIHHWAVADLFTGFAYLVFVAEYVGLAILTWARGYVREAKVFSYVFLLVNVMGFITYFVYPAAPPWYVAQYGFGPAQMHIHPNAAAAHRFDELLGTHLFDDVYGKGIDVFGALPSLHSAYPLIVALLAWKLLPVRFARWPAIAFSALMCFSAVYLQHHYVIDVVMGLAYGTVAVTVVTFFYRRTA